MYVAVMGIDIEKNSKIKLLGVAQDDKVTVLCNVSSF